MIGKVLLANADALCAAAVPLMDPDETLMLVIQFIIYKDIFLKLKIKLLERNHLLLEKMK